jgi:hypothetical protein
MQQQAYIKYAIFAFELDPKACNMMAPSSLLQLVIQIVMNRKDHWKFP